MNNKEREHHENFIDIFNEFLSFESIEDLENVSDRMDEHHRQTLRIDIDRCKEEGLSAKECLTEIKKKMLRSAKMAMRGIEGIPQGEQHIHEEVRESMKHVKGYIEEIYGVKFVKKRRK